MSGDVYPDPPGSDLGVPDRSYSGTRDNQYPQDLGRTYPSVSGDVYPDPPGSDLGVPNRSYSIDKENQYSQDLGRTYPSVSGDVYPNTAGSDLAVPRSSYSGSLENNTTNQISGDRVYANQSNIPASNLSADQVYSAPSMSNSFGSAERVYENQISTNSLNQIEQNPIYPKQESTISNSDVLSNFKGEMPEPVYPPVQSFASSRMRGDLGRDYPPVSGDFLIDKPINLGNLKPPDKYNISIGGYNSPKSEFE